MRGDVSDAARLLGMQGNPEIKNAFGIHNNDNGSSMNWDIAFDEENNMINNGLLREIDPG